MTKENAFNLFKAIEWNISEPILNSLLGYSKMILIDEIKEMHSYEELDFVEFLELIARVGDYYL